MPNEVVAEILRQGRGRPRRHVLAALTTGRVESNFQNLPGGHADSQGWRQERASLYSNPRNLSASVRRFYQEAAQHDRGQGVGELAADVQRPAEQYRGRYAEHLGEARQILRRGGAVRGAAGGGGGRRVSGRQVSGLRFSPGEAVDAASALAALSQPAAEQRPSVTLPAAPAFSAQAAMPAGYQPPETIGPPERGRLDVGGALEQLAAIANRDVPSDLTYTRERGIDRSPEGASTGEIDLSPRGGWGGTAGPIQALSRLAQEEGVEVTSGKRDTMSTASGGVSDHWKGAREAQARDFGGSQAEMDNAAVQVARALGVKYRKGQPLVANVNRNGIRYQLLYRTKVGGDHFDHFHVGAKAL